MEEPCNRNIKNKYFTILEDNITYLMADMCKLLQIQLQKLRNILNSSFTIVVFTDYHLFM